MQEPALDRLHVTTAMLLHSNPHVFFEMLSVASVSDLPESGRHGTPASQVDDDRVRSLLLACALYHNSMSTTDARLTPEEADWLNARLNHYVPLPLPGLRAWPFLFPVVARRS